MRTKQVKLEYDPEVDAAYLTLKSGTVAASQEVRPGVIVDFDSQSQILGVEILRFSRQFRPKLTPSTAASRKKVGSGK